jgi:type I restriction enzyme S subunit
MSTLIHISSVPKGWGSVRAKRLFYEVTEKGHPGEELLSATQGQGVLPRRLLDFKVVNPWEDTSNYKLVKPGDFVISLRSFQGGVEYSSFRGLVSPAYIVMRPRPGLATGFFRHYLKSDEFISRLQAVATGIRDGKTVRYEDFASLELHVPPASVGDSIACLLDRKIVAIDEFIRKKERLIELLQEKRQALITHTVTKGIEPNVPMKDSRVPWFGHIPVNWQVLPLRRVVDEFVDYRGRTPTKVDEGVPLITAGAVRDGRIDHSRAPEFMAAEEYEEFMRRGLPRKGDLVFTTEAPLGEVALVEDTSAAFAQRIILFRMNPRRMTSEYLWLFYQSSAGRDEVQSRGSGSTAEGIRADRLRASAVLVPPIAVQKMIVDVVTREMRKIEPLRAAIKIQVERLKEYRQALISAAVTGQLDIRSVEAA